MTLRISCGPRSSSCVNANAAHDNKRTARGSGSSNDAQSRNVVLLGKNAIGESLNYTRKAGGPNESRSSPAGIPTRSERHPATPPSLTRTEDEKGWGLATVLYGRARPQLPKRRPAGGPDARSDARAGDGRAPCARGRGPSAQPRLPVHAFARAHGPRRCIGSSRTCVLPNGTAISDGLLSVDLRPWGARREAACAAGDATRPMALRRKRDDRRPGRNERRHEVHPGPPFFRVTKCVILSVAQNLVK